MELANQEDTRIRHSLAGYPALASGPEIVKVLSCDQTMKLEKRLHLTNPQPNPTRLSNYCNPSLDANCQINSLDWLARKAKPMSKASPSDMAEI